jgi:hypothetical protein
MRPKGDFYALFKRQTVTFELIASLAENIHVTNAPQAELMLKTDTPDIKRASQTSAVELLVTGIPGGEGQAENFADSQGSRQRIGATSPPHFTNLRYSKA